MRYFNNYFTIIYALILALIVFFVFEFTSFKTFSGNGFILYTMFVIIGLFIIFMNALYKIKTKGEKNEKDNSKNR